MPEPELKGSDRTRGLIIGVIALMAILLTPPPGDMPLMAWRVAGVALLMAIWWISEALPIPATALVPLVSFPLLGVGSMRQTAAAYADPIIFLFLGGFVIGMAMQRWSLHKRIGLRAIMLIGAAPRRLIGGFLLSTAALSMWISNSATAVMMLPVAASVLALLQRDDKADTLSRENLSVALMLAVAYGASIGGLGTLIGSPPNALLAAYVAREHGVAIGFAQWMALGLPLVAALLAGTWLILVRLHPVSAGLDVGARQAVQAELAELGAMTAAEKRVAAVFLLTALGWIGRPLYAPYAPAIDDAAIAVAGALALFIIPSASPAGGRLLTWDDVRELPWGVLILFGGGLSLADAINTSGLAGWLGAAMAALASWPTLLIVAAAVLAMIILTELTSNTASAATFLPVAGAVAIGIGADPLALTAPIALAASCAFMLPVATPPNAIVFASGHLTVAQMARAGLWLNLVASAAIVLLGYPLVGWLFGA